MSDTDRVHRWRKRQREDGKEPMTIWLSHDEKLRLEDLAQTWHCSPSTLVQQALAQYHPGSPAVPGTLADTAQLRALVADIVAAMLARDLPARVRYVMQDLQPSLPQSPAVTATNGSVTDTAPTETDAPTVAPTRPTAQRKRREPPQTRPAGGQRKLTPRQVRALRDKHRRGVPVPALMEEYGISRASVFRYLQSDKRSGGAGGP